MCQGLLQAFGTGLDPFAAEQDQAVGAGEELLPLFIRQLFAI
jgi:hypothetical protein